MSNSFAEMETEVLPVNTQLFQFPYFISPNNSSYFVTVYTLVVEHFGTYNPQIINDLRSAIDVIEMLNY